MATALLEGKNAERMARALESIAISHAGNIDITDFKQIQEIVQLGRAKDFFQIGDQIVTSWTDHSNNDTVYEMPWDVVDFAPVIGDDGLIHKNAMWLQSHYVLPPVMFDSYEAFYVAPSAMPAGTYHISFAAKMGNYAPANTPFMFTLTQAVPAGGMLVWGTTSADAYIYGSALSNWRVRVYANGIQDDPTEMATVSQGDDGTDLGVLTIGVPYGNNGLNDVYRTYGYNRWSQSAIRQWLNSTAKNEEWWEQKNPFDRRPAELATMYGFEAGLPVDFLAIVKPVKVVTALNKSTDAIFGDSESTIDKFFLAALQQEYTWYQWEGEGVPFKYWVDRLGTEHKTGSANKRAEHIRYSLTNTSQASHARLRGANRGNSTYAFAVSTAGIVITPSASSALGGAPACVIY